MGNLGRDLDISWFPRFPIKKFNEGVVLFSLFSLLPHFSLLVTILLDDEE
jgi:hypothetical protein